MKVLFQSRVDIFDKRGGDTVQMEYTKKYIEGLNKGVFVDIKPSINEINIDDYDIVHVFNIDWVCETYMQVMWAKNHGKIVVLSAIHHSEKEVKRFENEARYDIRRIYNFLIPWQSTRDVSKNIYRSMTDKRKIKPTFKQVKMGIRNQQREIIKNTDLVLVQTDKEADDIAIDFKTEGFKWAKVVNGVNADLFLDSKPDLFVNYMKENHNIEPKNIMISVGRVEPRKNWLRIIEVFEQLKTSDEFKDWILVFIGDYNKNHKEYLWRFNKKVKENPDIYYLGRQSQELVASAFSMDGVFLNPSWFETTGLVALESAIAGMRPVVTGDRIKEYLGEEAVYCDPGDSLTIKNAIIKASKFGKLAETQRLLIKGNYSWENTAKQTLSVYNSLLKSQK